MNSTKQTLNDLLISFGLTEGLFKTASLLDWINQENVSNKTILSRCEINQDSFWFFDFQKSVIRNKNDSFFSISGIKRKESEQPIIIQNEVGYLGFIGKRINGILHFLMQAKIEPGNINNVQISPTIQATKSNFTQKHGGRVPHYLEYFKNVEKYEIVYDGEEPEQCSRFYKKYNRNVIIVLPDDEPLEILSHFKWMTIGQIKLLANQYDNLVNMDTRTVLSCIPYDCVKNDQVSSFDSFLFNGEDQSSKLLKAIHNSKSFSNDANLIKLSDLKMWEVNNKGIFCKHLFPFHFEYFDIKIDGREVTHWTQPLAVANGKALFALLSFRRSKEILFLIKEKSEIGCEKGVCYGPTIQLESPYDDYIPENMFEEFLFEKIKNKTSEIDSILSEEGGRFYHEENRNVVAMYDKEIDKEELENSGYRAANYKTIRRMIEKEHIVNIQLRNLLSLLEINYGKN
jgi:oxidase EvaA